MGFATRVAPGTMYQLLFAFMVTLVHMLFMSIYQPYRALDNGLRSSSNLSPQQIYRFSSRIVLWQTTSL